MTWQELFHLMNAFKVNAYNDTGGVQAEACQRLGVAYCGLVYNDDHLAFVAKHLDERVVPQCMMKEKHAHYQGTEMLAHFLNMLTTPNKWRLVMPTKAMDPIRIVALLPTWKTFVGDVLAAAVQWKCTQCAQHLETNWG